MPSLEVKRLRPFPFPPLQAAAVAGARAGTLRDPNVGRGPAGPSYVPPAMRAAVEEVDGDAAGNPTDDVAALRVRGRLWACAAEYARLTAAGAETPA